MATKKERTDIDWLILKANVEVVQRRTHILLQVAEIHSPVEIKREVFTNLIRRRWGIQ